LRIGAVTIFPEMFRAITDYGITSRAVSEGLLQLETVNPRTFTTDRHRTVDDRPYGGGPGMVMKPEPLEAALDSAVEAVGGSARVIYLSPQGRLLDQSLVEALAQEPALVLLSGRYEGVDERVIEARVDDEISIGDYVLSGGELASMVLVDAVVRQIPGCWDTASRRRRIRLPMGFLTVPITPDRSGLMIALFRRCSFRGSRTDTTLASEGITGTDAGTTPRPSRRKGAVEGRTGTAG